MAAKARYIAVCENWPNAEHPTLKELNIHGTTTSYYGNYQACTWMDKKNNLISLVTGRIDLEASDPTPPNTRAALKQFREQFVCQEHNLPPAGVWSTYSGMYRGLAARVKKIYKYTPGLGWTKLINADTIRKMW